ncbi:hypothetical protein P3T23_005408 [Paraburkholderia sp. GAS448]|uniref:hypothetical protein n=1 Tax=Paraburkholderia sp. GAS448 TaxID=3035136 RepID=UPI003D1C5121
MALTSNGLTNGGATNNYQFQYDDSLAGPGGIEPARTNQVIVAADADLNQIAGWFAGTALDVNLRIAVNITQNGGGASWNLSNGNLTVTINPATENANQVRYHLVMEMTEQFMRAQGEGWYGQGTEGSEGEGLSRFLATQFMAINGLGPQPAGFDNSNSWLSSARADYVNNIASTDDGPDKVTGCSLLFIYYLFAQLGFGINAIVAAGANTLGGVYRNLTGDTANPFPFFKQLVDTALPGTSTITSGNLDNPFPLGILSFWVDKSTFGRDEVTDVIASPTHGAFNNAFWLVLEGFNIINFNALGIRVPALSGPFLGLPLIGIAEDVAGPQFEDPTNVKIPQRIRFPFDITFQTAALAAFPNPGGGPAFEVLNAQATVGGNPLAGASATTEFELVGGADPYFTNVDPAHENVFYLSQDLRVFTATPGVNPAPVAGAPAFASDSFAGAYSYMQGVLTFLNDPNNHFTDDTQDPFASGVIPDQGAALTGDSSVTPFTVHAFPLQIFNNYNFAIARVRLRGNPGPADAAHNVKVFFRMWSTQTADTDFVPGSTYLSNTVGGKPEWPLPAPDSHTLPFFATGNSPDLGNPSNPEYGTGGVNNRTIQIASGEQAFAYFGCVLNVYDPDNKANGVPVQTLMMGTHHCLVAEIAYDDAPIVNANGVTMSPENSDKLAQRNLQVTHSDNPGPADTHRVPQTFDLRPSPTIMATAGQLLDYPDELMIDWGKTPVGSVAHIYWPQVDAPQVLSLASGIYGTHLLKASDAHTIDCVVTRGVTYVPIPSGTGENFAGLFTIDLPTTVTIGEEFNIVVRRVASRRARTDVPRVAARPRVEAAAGKPNRAEVAEVNVTAAAATKPGGTPAMRNWRYVVGTFQVKIPVTTSAVMLRPEENTLAIMRWRLQQMAPANRWYPVLQRYIDYIGARVDGLGGNSAAILPSPTGVPVKPPREGREHEFTGKVCEVLFDCFGDFEGFVLSDCCHTHAFKARERGIGEVVMRACKERLLVTVRFEAGREDAVCSLAIRC